MIQITSITRGYLTNADRKRAIRQLARRGYDSFIEYQDVAARYALCFRQSPGGPGLSKARAAASPVLTGTGDLRRSRVPSVEEPAMIVTIVTLYRGKMVEHFVGAVEGQLTDAQRHEMADKWGAHYHSREEPDQDEDDVEDRDEICFRTSTLAKSPAELTHLMNIDDDGVTLNQFAKEPS